MTTVVQTVPANGLAGVASKTLTLSSTGSGNSIIVKIAVEAGSTTYTGFTIADSQSNTYSNAALLAAGGRSAAVYYCLAPTAGVTSVTITGTGGTGGMFGCLDAQEVTGLTALDKHATGSAPGASPMTLNNSGANATAVAFVASAISVGAGASNCGISDPPSGYLTSSISQNDNTDGAGACCYRIDSSVVTDSVVWAATSWLPTAPAAIASFSGTAAAAAVLIPWQQNGQMGVQLAS
jgi:hypothetical protein